MNLNKGLARLGFVLAKDFMLEDFNDGKGVVVIWLSDKTQPTTAEIKVASDEWETEKYQRDRKTKYLDIGEQLDMQYWDAVNGTTLWQDHIAKIKSDIPKE